VFVSATNHGFDPRAYLCSISGDAIEEIHLAGFDANAELLIDTHAKPVCSDVWMLYGQLVSRIGPRPTLIEWDADIPALSALIAEAGKAQRLLEHEHAGAA